jgi:hypothetical protein
MRVEFSEQTKRQRFQAAGGRCECGGCPTCRGTLGFAISAGRCYRFFDWGQTAVARLDGYQFDHRGPSWDDSLANCRLLCFGCHKETPSYGRGLAGVFEAMEEQRRREGARLLGVLAAALKPSPPPAYNALAAALANPPSPYASALQALLGETPKAATLADLIGQPPKTTPW